MKAITLSAFVRRCRIVSVAAAISFLMPAMHGQTAGDGAIQGTVTDQSGAVVPNASVSAVNQATSVATQRTTNSDGLYVISPVIPGNYIVTVTAPGFREFRQTNLVVAAMNTAQVATP